MGQCSHRGGDSSGSAGTGFADAAFVHPHRDRAVGRRGEDLDVDPVGELGRVERHRGGDVERRQRLDRQLRVDTGQVRVADVDRQPAEAAATDGYGLSRLPNVLALPMSTLTSALVASTRCRTTGRGPASDPTTNSSRDSKPLARR